MPSVTWCLIGYQLLLLDSSARRPPFGFAGYATLYTQVPGYEIPNGHRFAARENRFAPTIPRINLLD